jgi:hypothetical protein
MEFQSQSQSVKTRNAFNEWIKSDYDSLTSVQKNMVYAVLLGIHFTNKDVSAFKEIFVHYTENNFELQGEFFTKSVLENCTELRNWLFMFREYNRHLDQKNTDNLFKQCVSQRQMDGVKWLYENVRGSGYTKHLLEVLTELCQVNDVKTLESFLSFVGFGANNYNKLFIAACCSNSVDTVMYLFEKGYIVLTRSVQSEELFDDMVASGNVEMVRVLSTYSNGEMNVRRDNDKLFKYSFTTANLKMMDMLYELGIASTSAESNMLSINAMLNDLLVKYVTSQDDLINMDLVSWLVDHGANVHHDNDKLFVELVTRECVSSPVSNENMTNEQTELEFISILYNSDKQYFRSLLEKDFVNFSTGWFPWLAKHKVVNEKIYKVLAM